MTVARYRYLPKRQPSPDRQFARLATDAATEAGERLISYVFSDTSVGRDNHVIAADAWQLDNFRKNPVFLFGHNDSAPPIGRVSCIETRNGQLVGTVEYADRDVSEFADTCFRLVKGGFLSATSTSWLPLEYEYSSDRSRRGGINFSKVELLEVSQVPVPALPTALATARAQGIDVASFADWATRELDAGRVSTKQKEFFTMVRSVAASAPTIYHSAGYAARAESAAGRAAALVEFPRQNAFNSFGEFLSTVARAAIKSERPDPRLTRGPSGANEVDPTAGGFLVPDNFTSELIGSLYEESVIATRCDRRETDKPENASLPAVDETSRADGSRWGGVLSYWKSEAITPPTTLPKFKAIKFMAHKLIALCVATEELIRDVPLLDGHLRRAFASEAAFQLDKSILLGTGAGVPWGIVGHPSTISVAKENGQSAATIVVENINNMWSRLPAPCRRRAAFFCNEDCEAQLDVMGLNGAVAGSGLYIPQGIGGNEYPLLKGRPLIVVEQCPALGTPGDIVLADLSQYLIIDGGLKSALSLEVDFLSMQGVFRFTLRVDGKPAWTTPITPYNSTSTRSPFVTLAQR